MGDENYTVNPVKLRITSEGTTATPWVLDGYDPASGDYTEEVWDFPEWQDAVNAMPRFVAYTRSHHGVRWPWDDNGPPEDRTADMLLKAADSLVGSLTAPEYIRALRDLISVVVGLPEEDVLEVTAHWETGLCSMCGASRDACTKRIGRCCDACWTAWHAHGSTHQAT